MAALPQEIISDDENVGPGSSAGGVRGDGPAAKGDDAPAAEGLAQYMGTARPAQLTPQKRPRTSGGGKPASQKKVVCESVMEAHGLAGKVLVDISGWCVDLSEAKDVAGARGVRKVLTMNVADGQAVIMVSLWSPMVEKVQEQLGSAYDNAPAGCFPKVTFQNLETVAVASSPLPLTKLQSRKDSTLKVLGATAWTLQPDASVVVSAFDGLNHANLTTSVRGTLIKLGELRYSKNDLPMRQAILMDGQKVGVPLMLTGWHAERALENGCEIVAYAVSSLPGLVMEDRGEETGGYFWVYSENYLAVLQPAIVKPEEPVTILHIT
eukprot:s280_g2.t1